MTLVVIGLPGVLVSLLVLFTVREPIRGMSTAAAGAPVEPEKPVGAFWSDAQILLRRPSLVFVAIAAGAQSMVIYGTASWLPAFYMRVHALSASEVGTALALISGLGAGVGTLMGGAISSRLSIADRRWLLWVPALSAALALPLYVYAALASEALTSLLALAPAAFLAAMFLGPALAAIHGLAGVALRATGIALVLFLSNMLGIGGGALVVGAVSDLFIAAEPETSLRYGLLVVYAANVVAVVSYLFAVKSLDRDWQEES
jgi:hypothetical protein